MLNVPKRPAPPRVKRIELRRQFVGILQFAEFLKVTMTCGHVVPVAMESGPAMHFEVVTSCGWCTKGIDV